MKISRKQQLLSQLNTINTYNLIKNDLVDIACNVYWIKNLPNIIDIDRINLYLVSTGAVAFFYDDVLKSILALPFNVILDNDLYYKPSVIEVYDEASGYRRTLTSDEYVIMYDNTKKTNLVNYIIQTAIRMTVNTKVSDINLVQQATPRYWNCKDTNEKSLRGMLSDIDNFEETITSYNQINFDETGCTLAPAPFLLDKLDLNQDRMFNRFLRKMGVVNISYEKKERNIKDEILSQQGGTLVSRNFRLNPRLKAIDEINKKWGTNLELMYYDFFEDESYNLSGGDSDES